MDLVLFILVIVVLVGLFYLLTRWESNIKKKYKEKAVRLLETPDPDFNEVKETIKQLRLYGGRIWKDKEVVNLVAQLQDKYGHLF